MRSSLYNLLPTVACGVGVGGNPPEFSLSHTPGRNGRFIAKKWSDDYAGNFNNYGWLGTEPPERS
jgi:hypothetical protein